MNEVDHIHKYIEEIEEILEEPVFSLDDLEPSLKRKLHLLVIEFGSIKDTLQDISDNYS